MKIFIALSLFAASLAVLPVASAECVETLCVGSSGFGTCDNGYASNGVSYYDYENGYTAVGAQTYCGGYPGYYSYQGIGAYAYECDASWNCDSAGAYWDGYNFFGFEGCSSAAYTYVDGTYTGQALPLCDVAGSPPAVPAAGV